jgi:hypothetical protein
MFLRPLLPVKNNIDPEKAASLLSQHQFLILPYTALRKGFQAVLSHGKGLQAAFIPADYRETKKFLSRGEQIFHDSQTP